MADSDAAVAGRLQALLERIKALPYCHTEFCDEGRCYEADVLDRASVLAALQEAPHAPHWQPIETHDGGTMPVLLAEGADSSANVVEGWYSPEHKAWWELNSYDDGSPGSDRRVYPTHWMPLPSPPGQVVEAPHAHPAGSTPMESEHRHRFNQWRITQSRVVLRVRGET